MLDKIRAETQSNVADIVMQEEIIVKEARQKIQHIENEISYEKAKTYAETQNCK